MVLQAFFFCSDGRTIHQQNIAARCFYFWSFFKVTETDTDVILGWEDFGMSYRNSHSNNGAAPPRSSAMRGHREFKDSVTAQDK